MTLRDELVERFFRYVAIESQSDSRSTSLPSTEGQRELALLLAAELRDLGLKDVIVDGNAIVTALRPGNRPGAPTIGFVAHLDTADVGLRPSIRPQILRFDGDDLCLNPEQDIWFRALEQPQADAWRGQDIIFSDGTSVLGADNKAAIAVIMTVLARLQGSEAHGDICVAFVPDEEIGLRGAKALDLSRFQCNFAYTIDCCKVGELVVENFNAASVEVLFRGVSAHPMSAKGVLVNPLFMAIDFVGRFAPDDTPECTEGRAGYFWFSDLVANDSEARLACMIRDFDEASFELRKRKIDKAAEHCRARFPRGQVEFTISDTYRNIGDSLGDDPRPVEILLAAMQNLDIEPRFLPMRGGTDGAALSARGMATPNFFTGAHNFHSRFEFLPLPAFEKSYQTARLICELAARQEVRPL